MKKLNDLPNVNIISINGESCSNNGQYIIYGEISDTSKVEEKYSNINILLSSTQSIGLCEVNINIDDKNITIICQNSDKFEMSQIRIEKKMIKKKNKELFLIEGKSFSLNGKKSCDNYDTVRKALLEQRMNSKISYSLMSNVEIVDQALQYFMAFERESDDISFEEFYTFYTSISVSTRRALRALETNTISDIPVTCKLNQSLVIGTLGGYNCKSDTNDIKGTLLSMTLDTDEIGNIQGIYNRFEQ